ncbi:MIB1 [Branchiostoma lanceolatum]|uniref:MIB1 protein n=1 Tax=Branchiostoma lanceolatum TaxID=7740 RepID=A0A8K0AEU9_BRALA|nr:MIB1 [Branchiostoma lanceolatum]
MEPKSKFPQKQNPEDLLAGQKASAGQQQGTAGQQQVNNRLEEVKNRTELVNIRPEEVNNRTELVTSRPEEVDNRREEQVTSRPEEVDNRREEQVTSRPEEVDNRREEQVTSRPEEVDNRREEQVTSRPEEVDNRREEQVTSRPEEVDNRREEQVTSRPEEVDNRREEQVTSRPEEVDNRREEQVTSRPEEVDNRREEQVTSRPEEVDNRREEQVTSRPEEVDNRREEQVTSRPEEVDNRREEQVTSRPEEVDNRREEQVTSRPEEVDNRREEQVTSRPQRHQQAIAEDNTCDADDKSVDQGGEAFEGQANGSMEHVKASHGFEQSSQPIATPKDGNNGADWEDDEAVSEIVNKTIHKGDHVKLHVDSVETLQLLHEGRGEIADLQKAIGETGVAIRTDENEFVHVYFRNHKRVWSINPAALLKVGPTEPSALITEGDLVMIRTDKDQMRDLLKGHGDWVYKMESTLGKSGRVTKITDQGHLCVKVDGKVWRYNPEAVKKILPSGHVHVGAETKMQDVQTVDCVDLVLEKVTMTKMIMMIRKEDCSADWRNTGAENTPPASVLASAPRRGEGSHVHEKASHDIAEGDNVRVTMNQRTLPVIHKQHGLEWHDNMLEVVGMEGKVTKVTAKCVAVQFPNQARWHLAPGCLRRISLKGRDGVPYQKGDLVRVIKDEGKLKKLQSHCGFKRNMEATLGKIGCVMNCKDGKVKVDVMGRTWWFSPAVLSYTTLRERRAHVRDGDYVKVDVDAETFKNCQVCHGGYVDNMKKLLEQVGVVHHVDIDGDAVVYYPDGTRWCINAMSLGKVDPGECASVDVSGVLEVGDWVKVESDKNKIRYVQETTDDLKEVFGSGDISSPGVARGDLVKIAVDFNKLRMLQDGHGGFVDKMDEACGKTGRLMNVHDGDRLRVKVIGTTFFLNPQLVTRQGNPGLAGQTIEIVLVTGNQPQSVFLANMTGVQVGAWCVSHVENVHTMEACVLLGTSQDDSLAVCVAVAMAMLVVMTVEPANDVQENYRSEKKLMMKIMTMMLEGKDQGRKWM